MAPVTFERGISLTKLSDNTFRSQQVPWTWPRSTIVPGGILMALAANAAYQTTQQGFSIDTLSCHFLAAPKADVPFDIKVQRLSDGGRFCSRVAVLEQGGSVKVHVTCSFVRPSSMTGPSMQHSRPRQSKQRVDAITLDDLAVERGDIGPYMKFQRLPLFYTGPGQAPRDPPPESLVYTSVARMSPLGSDSDGNIHTIGLVALSDYHILDCPPTVHGRRAGTAAINDRECKPTSTDFQFMTSLNHSIRFHAHDGFRADELLYIEASSPWTRGRRAQIDSRIFSKDGKLLATCAQEAYFVMKEESEQSGQRSWVMEEEEEQKGGGSKL